MKKRTTLHHLCTTLHHLVCAHPVRTAHHHPSLGCGVVVCAVSSGGEQT